jgi:hypothetical protein
LSRKNAFKYRLENYFTSWIFLSTFRQWFLLITISTRSETVWFVWLEHFDCLDINQF